MNIFPAGRCQLDLKFIMLRHLLKEHQHQPQCFFAGGEEEGIAAGVGPCQVFPGEITDEGGGGSFEVLLQLLVVWTITNQGEACLGKGFQHGSDPFDLLFR